MDDDSKAALTQIANGVARKLAGDFGGGSGETYRVVVLVQTPEDDFVAVGSSDEAETPALLQGGATTLLARAVASSKN